MKALLKSIFVLTLVSVFASCESAYEEQPKTLNIQEKVALLEGNEWLLKDFEDRVMHTFVDGKRQTQYGEDSVFFEVLPGKETYEIVGDLLKMDFNFGHVYTFEVRVSCENRIVEFYREGELNTTLYLRGANYKSCL